MRYYNRTVITKLKKCRGQSTSVIGKKIRDHFLQKAGCFFDKWNYDKRLSDDEFVNLCTIAGRKLKSIDDLVKYFQNRKSLDFIDFQCGNINDGNVRSSIILKADKICKHIFNLLGSDDVELGIKINWHQDFKTGYQWKSKKYYKDIKIPYGKADIKVPWELSRFQHVTILGQAYQMTGNEKYAQEFMEQIEGWISKNPPRFGVNWQCAMDVAIRSANWVVGYYYFKDSINNNTKFLIGFLKSLYQHGKHIIENLEYSKTLTSNHYLSDISGLLILSVTFSEFKEAEEWKKFCIRELVGEMEKQVYEDGCDFEASTCYHRLVLELFFFSTYIVVCNDDSFDGNNYMQITEKLFGCEYAQKLYKMFDAACYLIKPNGRMPQIGDNDSGQFFKLYPRDILDMRYLLALGAVFFNEAKWKIKEFFQDREDVSEILLVYGEKGEELWDNLAWNNLSNINSKAFHDAGWYVMRDNKNYCIISCGPNGQNGNGGHCHNDKLSFELCLDEKDIIVDPGTYVYTVDPHKRNEFRSTISHNTVTVNGKEQNRIDPENLFFMSNDAPVKCLKWEVNDARDVFIGEHYGYKRFKNPLIHQREIMFYKKIGKLEIIDRFIGVGGYSFVWNFNFLIMPAIKCNIIALQKKPSWYSSEYGRIERIQKFITSLNTATPSEIKFEISMR